MNGEAAPAVALLGRLLMLSERSPDRLRPASLSPDYNELPTASSLSRFQEQMEAAERSGAVSIRKGKRERRHIIERITVKDPVALARHLGRDPSNVTAKEARLMLDACGSGGADWVVKLLDEIESRWSRGEQAFRLQPDQTTLAREFVTLLAAISKDQARGLDARTFSLRVTGDTKAFDRHATRIANVLVIQFGQSDVDPHLVWEQIGLERYSHPVHVHGPLVAQDDAGILVNGQAKPFASVHPDLFPFLRLSAQPSLLLTIENYASFNRYVREVDDGALVIYTGGFASAAVVEILKLVLSAMASDIPFFHWGDIDPGGLRIFRFLEESLPRKPQPYLMDRATAEIHGNSAKPDPTLATIVNSDSAISNLAAWLAQGNDIKHLEQEALDPRSPLEQQY